MSPLFFRVVDIFADLCDDNHHEGQIEREIVYVIYKITCLNLFSTEYKDGFALKRLDFYIDSRLKYDSIEFWSKQRCI